MAQRILLVIDMQNDFIDGSLGTKEAVAIVPAVVQRIREERLQNSKIVFTRDTHTHDYASTLEGKMLPVAHCVMGTKGHEIAPVLLPFAGDALIIDKLTFGSVALPEIMREDIDAQTEIYIVGLCTDICVVSNALLLRAHYPNNHIFVVESCCAGVTPGSHAAALETMRMCQIEII